MSQLAARDPYTTSFEAEVTSADGRAVTLEETYFYAESGGQPADRGNMAGVEVEHVEKQGEEVVHHLADDPKFEAGDTVQAQIDPEFRTYAMRAHTASHVLYGAGRRLLDDLGYGGFDIGSEKVRVDFTTSTDIDDETLVELERLTNRAVWDSLPVTWEEISEEAAREREDIAFNTKTEEGVMSDSDVVRVVDIDGWDVAACGGTHVENTREIGPVTVLSRSNPGEGLTRVEFAVGPAAIRRRAEDARAAREAAQTLDVGVSDLPEAAERANEDIEQLESDLQDAKSEVLDARLTDLQNDPVARNGNEWLVGTVADFGPNEVGDRAKELVGDESTADAVVLTGKDGATFVVAATSGDPEAGEIVDDVTAAFGGGGGGSPTFAQGGGLDADPKEVVTFLRE